MMMMKTMWGGVRRAKEGGRERERGLLSLSLSFSLKKKMNNQPLWPSRAMTMMTMWGDMWRAEK